MTDGDGPDATEENLSTRTLRGIKWTYVSALLTAVIQLTYSASMSRLLDDEAFGLVAMAQIVVNLGRYFAQLGVGRALIQKRSLEPIEIRAAATSFIGLGVVAAGVLWLAAPALAVVFQAPDVTDIMRWVALTFIILGLGSTADALLDRALRFRELAITDLWAFVVGYLVVGIPSAALGAGVYSLVAAGLTTHTVATVAKYHYVRHSLRPTFKRSAYRHLYGFGIRASGLQVLEYLGNNLDTFVAGRYVSTGLLGQYSRAFYLVQLPMEYLAQNVGGVLFPSLSKLQDEPDRLRRAYLGIFMIVGALVIPICVGLAVAAPEIVRVVLGPGWEPAAAVVPLIAVAASGKVLSRLPSILAEARAKLGAKFAVEGTTTVILVVLLYRAIGGGLAGYAWALVGAEAVRHVLYQFILGRTVGITWRELPRAYRPMLVTSLVVGLSIGGVRGGLIGIGAPVGVVFAAEVMTGAVTLALTVRFGPVDALRRELAMRLTNAGVLPSTTPVIQRGAGLLLGRAASPTSTGEDG